MLGLLCRLEPLGYLNLVGLKVTAVLLNVLPLRFQHCLEVVYAALLLHMLL